MLKAGLSAVDITPPAGVRQAGYAGRTLPSLAVHDPPRSAGGRRRLNRRRGTITSTGISSGTSASRVLKGSQVSRTGEGTRR
jgi:hypothetical protein